MSEKESAVPEHSAQQQKQPGREALMSPEPEIIRDTYRGSDKLKGRVALITGGDSGIGRAVAVHFAREGADISIVYLEEDEDAKATRAMVEAEGRKCLIDYAATKGAIVSFTRALSDDLAPQGIRVNAVAPGPIWTPLIPATFDPEHVANFGKSTPMGRPGQPSEVAPAYVFLASRDASYISGQSIHVNGGEPVSS